LVHPLASGHVLVGNIRRWQGVARRNAASIGRPLLVGVLERVDFGSDFLLCRPQTFLPEHHSAVDSLGLLVCSLGRYSSGRSIAPAEALVTFVVAAVLDAWVAVVLAEAVALDVGVAVSAWLSGCYAFVAHVEAVPRGLLVCVVVCENPPHAPALV